MDDHLEDPAARLTSQGIRAALMAATVAAEQVARHWQNQKQRQASASAADAARWSSRYDTQRRLARIEVGAPDDQWIRGADPDQVARIWETARAWSQLEPAEFGPSAEKIRTLVHDTYGIDLPADSSTAEQLRDAATRERSAAETSLSPGRDPKGTQGIHDILDESTAATIIGTTGLDAAADQREDATNGHTNAAQTLDAAATTVDESYDTPQRREALTRRAVDAGVDPDTAQGRTRASTARGRPVGEATAAGTASFSGHGPAPAKTRQRSADLER